MKPIFVYPKLRPLFGRFTGITLLCFVIVFQNYDYVRKAWYKPTLTDRFKRHETWHVWQQLCLAALGIILAPTGLLLGIPWWVCLAVPVVLPFALYVLCWFVEILLPPYSRAYHDICFEGEARYHEYDKNPRYVPFSFLRFILNRDWSKLGRDKYLR